MKLKIAVCDDLRTEQIRLAQFIRSYCAEQSLDASIQLFSSGEELLDSFQPGKFHILFLDVYMYELSGIDTARKIREQDQTCAIIFATTSEEHGLVSYEVQASDYLVKPFDAEMVASAMEWCVDQIRSTFRMLTIRCENDTVQISLRDLRYIEIQGHTAMLYTQDGVLATRRSLDELEQEIDHEDFLRCHRSFLVNMNHIHLLEKNSFRLHGGEIIPIGSTITAKVKDQYMSWFFIKTWAQK